MSENEKFTQQELQEFSEKLEAWGESLSAREQMLLTVLLERSEEESEENDDVEGFGGISTDPGSAINFICHSASMVSWVLRNRMTKSSGGFGFEIGPIGIKTGKLNLNRQRDPAINANHDGDGVDKAACASSFFMG